MKLTIKQENFCNKYLECGNASEAYRHAYSCSKMKPNVINNKAYKLLCRGYIGVRVKELQEELKSISDISKERNLKVLANIAYTSIAHFHESWEKLKDFKLLTEDQKSCIKSIQHRTRIIPGGEESPLVEVEEVKIELHDKLKAIDMINKIMGFESSTKHEVTGKNGDDIKISPLRIEIVNTTKKNGDSSNN